MGDITDAIWTIMDGNSIFGVGAFIAAIVLMVILTRGEDSNQGFMRRLVLNGYIVSFLVSKSIQPIVLLVVIAVYIYLIYSDKSEYEA